MTTTATATEPVPTPDTWTAEIEQLRARHKAVREPILAALNLLLQDPGISDDDAKARAAMHGVRITAASLNGARNLMAKREATPATGPANEPATAAAPTTRAPRRPRAPDAAVDAEALIRQVVGKLQEKRNAEVERLRDAVRKAMAVLQAAVG